jgi:ABC-type nitrate/sulfonate/bicarbonate transport system substrate-binding protein
MERFLPRDVARPWHGHLEISMRRTKKPILKILQRRKPLIIGFLPENDCAPLVVAHEMGFFKKYGLHVELQRELSWKNIHQKVASRQLQAGQAPAALPFLIHLGLTPDNAPCVTGLVLSLQGNAITISRELWNRGVCDATGLHKQILRDRRKRVYTFGVSCPLASSYHLLCQWLKLADIPPGIEVRIVPAPPSQMFPLLKLGYLDGYCVGEPWTTLAVQDGVGACVSTSCALAPLHPEKVLLVRKDFAEKERDKHERLIAALIEACRFCDRPQNRHQLCELLSMPHYVNAPVECLEPSLVGPFGPADGSIQSLHGLNIFYRHNANDPTTARANAITARLYDFLRWDRRPAGLNSVFRRDIYHRSLALVKTMQKEGNARAGGGSSHDRLMSAATRRQSATPNAVGVCV